MAMRPDKKFVPVVVFMALAALACVCGPIARIQTGIQRAQNAAGTAQAVATDVGDVVGTGQAFATAVSTAEQGFATQLGPVGATFEAGLEELGPTLIAADLEMVRQWPLSATATSQREVVNYSAAQAVGAPNTAQCGDATSAWAPLIPQSTQEELTLHFSEPVLPTEINIYETFNPGAVVQVRMVDVFGNTPVVYQSEPLFILECPRTLTIPVSGVTVTSSVVIITINQLNSPGGAQIDAVELVGLK